jgi:hypothetical protein
MLLLPLLLCSIITGQHNVGRLIADPADTGIKIPDALSTGEYVSVSPDEYFERVSARHIMEAKRELDLHWKKIVYLWEQGAFERNRVYILSLVSLSDQNRLYLLHRLLQGGWNASIITATVKHASHRGWKSFPIGPTPTVYPCLCQALNMANDEDDDATGYLTVFSDANGTATSYVRELEFGGRGVDPYCVGGPDFLNCRNKAASDACSTAGIGPVTLLRIDI